MNLNLKPYIEKPIEPKRVQAVRINESNQQEITNLIDGYRVFCGDWLVIFDDPDKEEVWTDYAFHTKFQEIEDANSRS